MQLLHIIEQLSHAHLTQQHPRCHQMRYQK